MKYNFRTKQFIETEVSPNKLAVVGSELNIDWATLKNSTEHLVSIFKGLNIPNGHPVIIYGHKEHLYPMVILACMHSNTTYIPIDKIYPLNELKKLLR
jgi:D-alanine--poly(phosphoribitol) ligase subunit 1